MQAAVLERLEQICFTFGPIESAPRVHLDDDVLVEAARCHRFEHLGHRLATAAGNEVLVARLSGAIGDVQVAEA